MTHSVETASGETASAEAPVQGTPNKKTVSKKITILQNAVCRCGPCLCCAGGMVAVHAVHFAGVAAILGMAAALGAAFGVIASAGILGGWYLWRFAVAGRFEKGFMYASTAASILFSVFGHAALHEHTHHMMMTEDHMPMTAAEIPAAESAHEQHGVDAHDGALHHHP